MATRAERFRATVERKGGATGRKRRASARRGRSDFAERATAELAAERGTLPSVLTARRNMSRAKSSRYQLETAVVPERPSRKQTRRSNNRQKTDSVLKARQELRVNSPQRRSAEHRKPGRLG
jgi:hypothetical protein